MASVADTRTHADAHLEQRQLREGNAVLVQQRDTLLREIGQWQPVLHAIREEIAKHLDIPVLTATLEGLLSTSLLEKRDALQREIDEKTATSQDLDVKNEVKAKALTSHDATIGAKEARVALLKAEEEKHQGLALKAAQSHEKAKAEAEKELPLLLEATAQARNHLAGVQLEEEVLLQARRDDEMRLSRKSRDLAIYEDRIRVAAAKLNPPMQIHV